MSFESRTAISPIAEWKKSRFTLSRTRPESEKPPVPPPALALAPALANAAAAPGPKRRLFSIPVIMTVFLRILFDARRSSRPSGRTSPHSPPSSCAASRTRRALSCARTASIVSRHESTSFAYAHARRTVSGFEGSSESFAFSTYSIRKVCSRLLSSTGTSEMAVIPAIRMEFAASIFYNK